MRLQNSLLLFLFSLGPISAYINNEEIFLNANKYYREQQFQKALELYDSLPQQGWPVLFNKACCFFHEDNFVQAIKYWQKALLSGGHSYKDQIESNCACAAQHLSLPYQYSWQNKLYLLTQKIPQFFWQLIFLFLLYAIVFLFIMFRGLLRGIILLLTSLFILIMSIMIFRYYYESQKFVIIVQPSSLYAGRDSLFSKMSDIPQGAIVCVRSSNKEWSKICYHGKLGWIESSQIELI